MQIRVTWGKLQQSEEEAKEQIKGEIFLIERLTIVKISVLPNLIHSLNAIPIKIPAIYFVDIDRLILKFVWRARRLRIADIILKEKVATAQLQGIL
jgi:hypothetical protein